MSEISDSDFSEEDMQDGQGTKAQNVIRLPGAMPLVPRTDHIDEKLRRKIRKGEYISLRLLLGDKKRNRKEHSSEDYTEDDNLPMSRWVDAFVVFISIYI